MPYCSKCGVEVDDSIKKCPLCNTQIQHYSETPLDKSAKFPSDDHLPGNNFQLTAQKKRELAWMIITVVLLTPFFIIIAIDMMLNRGITWSGYPLSALGCTWLCVGICFLWYKKPVPLTVTLMTLIIVFLLIMNLLEGKLDWFFNPALPITLAAYASCGISVLPSIKAKRKGANIAAFVLLGIGFMCVSIDLSTTVFIYHEFKLLWSLIILAALIPISLFLLYYHYVMKRDVNLHKFFHF